MGLSSDFALYFSIPDQEVSKFRRKSLTAFLRLCIAQFCVWRRGYLSLIGICLEVNGRSKACLDFVQPWLILVPGCA